MKRVRDESYKWTQHFLISKANMAFHAACYSIIRSRDWRCDLAVVPSFKTSQPLGCLMTSHLSTVEELIVFAGINTYAGCGFVFPYCNATFLITTQVILPNDPFIARYFTRDLFKAIL